MEYQYRDLGSINEIRILVLKPAAAFDHDLHARIVHRRIPIEEEDDSGINHWNAVSYTWGTDAPSKILYIDSTFPHDPNSGCTWINITPNVDTMLRHLRDGHEEHALWIDAICLNQNNMPEKNQQVPRMSWIYRLALQVPIWLGEDDGTAWLGMKLVEALPMIGERPELANHPNSTSILGLALRQHLGDQQPHALDRLFHRPWFGRRWILQEVALALQPIVCCGKYQLPWDKFRAGMEVISDAQSRGLLLTTQLVDDLSTRALTSLLKVNRVSGQFLDLLWNFDTSACKEKHDVLYALSGLVTDMPPASRDQEVASSISFSVSSDADLGRLVDMASHFLRLPEEPLALQVDYSIPWHQLFTQVAAYYVSKLAFASITRHLYAFGSLHETNSEWPSWVPDWSRPRRPEPVGGMSNVVPWSKPIEVRDDALHIEAWKLTTCRNAVSEFPATHHDFRRVIRRLLEGTDATPVPTKPEDHDGDNIRDLTVSEALIGDLLSSGLETGLCRPVMAESEEITDPWIVNHMAGQAIARVIFTPEWRAAGRVPVQGRSTLDGIMSCLQGTSLFVTDDFQLGIGPGKMKDGDHVVLLYSYHGLPDLSRRGRQLQQAAILRPVDQQDGDQSQMIEHGRYILIGPCILVQRTNTALPDGIPIKLV
jgi:hypothetical protein